MEWTKTVFVDAEMTHGFIWRWTKE